MTEDFKKNILNYVTNNIEQTSPTSAEIFKEIIDQNTSEWKNFLPKNFHSFRFEGLVSTNDGISDITVVYGGYTTASPTATNAKGIIILLDNNFKPIKSFLKYDNGTDLRYIQCMNVDEDGQFYMIDDTGFSPVIQQLLQNSTKRFVMLGNIAVKSSITNDYSLNMRKSYILSGNYQNFYCKYMVKNPDSAHYVFVGGMYYKDSQGFSGYNKVKAISLIINVGSSNEWQYTQTNVGYKYSGAIVVFNSQDQWFMRCLATKYETGQTRYITEIFKRYTENTFNYSNLRTYNYAFSSESLSMQNQCIFTNLNTCYFVLMPFGEYTDSSVYVSLNKYNFSNGTLTKIFEKKYGNYPSSYSPYDCIYLSANLGDVYVQYITNISNNKANFYCQRLKNDNWSPKLVVTNKYFNRLSRAFFVKNNYNLLQIFSWQTTAPSNNTEFNQVLIKENYNSLNYNGQPYTNYNSMLSKQGEIYSNNSLVFARNIYNKTLNENQTVSTVAIPNNYLNDIELDSNRLLSETNSVVVNNEEAITKNIYETLFLNYVNSISVIDEDTGTLYPNAATFVNTNINVGTQANCSTSNVGLIQINTPTPTTQSIFWEPVDDTHKETSFALQVNEMIPTIDFKSADGTTTYLTIDTSDLEVGETYTISQKLRIE